MERQRIAQTEVESVESRGSSAKSSSISGNRSSPLTPNSSSSHVTNVEKDFAEDEAWHREVMGQACVTEN